MSEPANRHERRKKLQVRRAVVLQAIHHLGNFLTITTTMSARACSLAASPEQAKEARRQFFQLFGEVATTMAGLDEVANPEHTAELQGVLDKLKASPEYKEMMARGEAERIAECYVFLDGRRCESAMSPDEHCFEVSLRHPCRDFGGWLIGKICQINDGAYAVMGVEYAPLKQPFKAGDKVRLVVRPVAADGTFDTSIPERSHGDREEAPAAASACAARADQGDDPSGPSGRADARADGGDQGLRPEASPG